MADDGMMGARVLRPLRAVVLAGLVGLSALTAVADGAGQASSATAARPVVYLVPIEGVIDLGLAAFVTRALDEATAAGIAAVIFEVNTFGGRVDAAVLIRDALLRARVRTVAFVDKRAISAGALIALAAETVVMADGGTIGAAAPVEIGGPGGSTQPVAEKTVSYVRKEFRATAESRKRPFLLAEAMVDADVEIPGLSAKGKLLTLTTEEALTHGLADFRADSVEALLATLGLGSAEVRRVAPAWAEIVVRFLTHPLVSSLLTTVGILGIIVELRAPGLGVPGAVGVGSLALFLWGHWLVRLAGWEEVLLVAVGLLLLTVEIFVTPGFGLAGMLGLVALLGGLGLSLVGVGATWPLVLRAVVQVAASLLVAVVASVVMLRFLPRLPFGRRLVLATELDAGDGFASAPSAPEADLMWLGKRGTAASTLRPAGIALLEGDRVDVVSDGEFIEAGEPITVVKVDGNRIVVRQLAERTQS
jgi:membrane-bound serine protease (ClpP class)